MSWCRKEDETAKLNEKEQETRKEISQESMNEQSTVNLFRGRVFIHVVMYIPLLTRIIRTYTVDPVGRTSCGSGPLPGKNSRQIERF